MLVLQNGQRPTGNEVILGIRPEDVQVTAGKLTEGLEAVISVIEPAGAITWADVLREGEKIRGVVLQEEGLAPHSKASVRLVTDRAVLFAPPQGRDCNRGYCGLHKRNDHHVQGMAVLNDVDWFRLAGPT